MEPSSRLPQASARAGKGPSGKTGADLGRGGLGAPSKRRACRQLQQSSGEEEQLLQQRLRRAAAQQQAGGVPALGEGGGKLQRGRSRAGGEVVVISQCVSAASALPPVLSQCCTSRLGYMQPGCGRAPSAGGLGRMFELRQGARRTQAQTCSAACADDTSSALCRSTRAAPSQQPGCIFPRSCRSRPSRLATASRPEGPASWRVAPLCAASCVRRSPRAAALSLCGTARLAARAAGSRAAVRSSARRSTSARPGSSAQPVWTFSRRAHQQAVQPRDAGLGGLHAAHDLGRREGLVGAPRVQQARPHGAQVRAHEGQAAHAGAVEPGGRRHHRRHGGGVARAGRRRWVPGGRSQRERGQCLQGGSAQGPCSRLEHCKRKQDQPHSLHGRR